jgi:hypothetical protein
VQSLYPSWDVRQSIAVVETIKDDVIEDDGRVRMMGVVSSVLSTEFASDLPLGAEDRETNAKRECLPLAAELLATSGTGKVAAPVSDTEKGAERKG